MTHFGALFSIMFSLFLQPICTFRKSRRYCCCPLFGLICCYHQQVFAFYLWFLFAAVVIVFFYAHVSSSQKKSRSMLQHFKCFGWKIEFSADVSTKVFPDCLLSVPCTMLNLLACGIISDDRAFDATNLTYLLRNFFLSHIQIKQP